MKQLPKAVASVGPLANNAPGFNFMVEYGGIELILQVSGIKALALLPDFADSVPQIVRRVIKELAEEEQRKDPNLTSHEALGRALNIRAPKP